MSTDRFLPGCPNPTCAQPHVIRNGSKNGRKRFHCRGCGRFWGETEGTPVYGLRTPVAEIAYGPYVRNGGHVAAACGGACRRLDRGVHAGSASEPGGD
jgi:transposase-like protein